MAKTDSKAVIANLKKYHFWILFGLAVLVTLVLWWMATATLAEKYTKRVQKLDGDLKAMQTVQTEADHPNERVVAQIRGATTEANKKAFEAWKFLYSEQEERNPWPKVLGQEFLDEVSNNKTTEISAPSRELYQNFIKEHFPTLREVVNVRRPLDPAAEAAADGTPSAASADGTRNREKPVEMTGLVIWDSADFDRMRKRFDWPTVPTSIEVRMAQEDLWVYEALLRIIKDTNEGVRENDHEHAHVKRIDVMAIGQEAAAAWEKAASSAPKFARPQTGEGESAEGPPPDAAGGEQPAAEGGEQPGIAEDPVARRLRDKRYVNEKGRPLSAGERNPFPELKLMPIYMRLLVDQMYVPRLLANCANRNMPVEVRQMRIGSPASGETLASIAGGSGGGSSAPSSAPSGSEIASGGPAGDARASEYVTLDMPVDVFGIITIYNPPPEKPAAAPGEAAPESNPGEAPANPEPNNSEPAAAAPAEPAAPAAKQEPAP